MPIYNNNPTIAAVPIPIAQGGTGAASFSLAGLAQLGVAESFTAGQRGAVVPIVSAANLTPINMAAGNNFAQTTTENTQLGVPTNQVAGQAGVITFTQGNPVRLLTFAADWKFSGGNPPALTAIVGAVDTLSYYVIAPGNIEAALSNNLTNLTPPGALLHFDGANLSQAIVDVYGHAWICVNASTAQSTNFARFGSASLFSAGMNSRVETGDFATLGANGWTLECWIYQTGLYTQGFTVGVFGATNAGGFGAGLEFYYTAGGGGGALLRHWLSSNGVAWDIAPATDVALPNLVTGAWTHVALCRDNVAGAYYSYWGGAPIGSFITAGQIAAINNMSVSLDYPISTQSLTGYLDEFRYSSSCRYPGGIAFVPSTVPFTS